MLLTEQTTIRTIDTQEVSLAEKRTKLERRLEDLGNAELVRRDNYLSLIANIASIEVYGREYMQDKFGQARLNLYPDSTFMSLSFDSEESNIAAVHVPFVAVFINELYPDTYTPDFTEAFSKQKYTDAGLSINRQFAAGGDDAVVYSVHIITQQFAYIVYLASSGEHDKAKRIYNYLENEAMLHDPNTGLWASTFRTDSDQVDHTRLGRMFNTELWCVMALISIGRHADAEKMLAKLQDSSLYDSSSQSWHTSQGEADYASSLMQIVVESKLLKQRTEDIENETQPMKLPLTPQF